jgi:hypothetical protein
VLFEADRILFIVVNVVDVGLHVEVAAGIDAGPGWIYCLSDAIDLADQVVILAAV